MSISSDASKQALIVYDEKGRVIWQGEFVGSAQMLSVGEKFWIGTPAKRNWYTILRAVSGLDIEAKVLTTEIAVETEAAPAAEGNADGASSGVKGNPRGSSEERLMASGDIWKWRNPANTIEVIVSRPEPADGGYLELHAAAFDVATGGRLAVGQCNVDPGDLIRLRASGRLPVCIDVTIIHTDKLRNRHVRIIEVM